MNKKQQRNNNTPTKQEIVDIAFTLAVDLGWENITLADIAAEAKLSLPDLFDLFEDKTDILVAYGRQVDRQVLEVIGAGEPDMPMRDRLFDILMERFDIIAPQKQAIVSILKSFAFDPKQALVSCPHLCRSMIWMLEAAGGQTAGIKGAAKVAGLTAIYLSVLRVWKDDETEDLSKTMAALDRSLSRAEKIANMVGF